ncbi:toxin [Caedibacter taeniospiralis]|uniref:toxin n=1 Tax=Caedibacter taeniospiralis TaxID=28907 RepID=UPI0018EECB16|nr:toxin [Caedibacter taeniospiralis]
MKFKYSEEKNSWLLEQRGIGFAEMITEIEKGNIIDIVMHTNQTRYPHQRVMRILCLGTVYCVPYVKDTEDVFFLKTLYPSRKATKEYLRQLKEE